MRRQRAESAGREGERQAALYLQLKGCTSLNVAATVEAVAHQYATSGEDIRIDALLLAPRTLPRHIVNAW